MNDDAVLYKISINSLITPLQNMSNFLKHVYYSRRNEIKTSKFRCLPVWL